MNTIKIFAFTALLAGAFTLPAVSAHAEGDAASKTPTEKFKALDADRSGSLSEAEFSKHTTASVDFKQADSNADGRITLGELQAIEQNAQPAAPAN